EIATKKSKPNPAISRASQKHRQKRLAGRKSKQRHQSQDRGPIGFFPRPIFFQRAFLFLDGFIRVVVVMMMLRVTVVGRVTRMTAEEVNVSTAPRHLADKVENSQCH